MGQLIFKLVEVQCKYYVSLWKLVHTLQNVILELL